MGFYKLLIVGTDAAALCSCVLCTSTAFDNDAHRNFAIVCHKRINSQNYDSAMFCIVI